MTVAVVIVLMSLSLNIGILIGKSQEHRKSYQNGYAACELDFIQTKESK